MTESPARLLILTYGVLMALFDLVALLPGNPDVSVPGGLFLAVVVQTLIVWRLWHQSGIAWSFGVVVPLLYVIALGADGCRLGDDRRPHLLLLDGADRDCLHAAGLGVRLPPGLSSRFSLAA
jgi:hypothetical protein